MTAQREYGTILHGVAASSHIDKSGEVVSIEGIDISSLGGEDSVANWEHNSKTDPSVVVGKVTFAKKILKEKDATNKNEKYFWKKCKKPFIYVKIELFDHLGHSGAENVAAMFRYDNRDKGNRSRPLLAFSIEGGKLDQNGMEVKKSIARDVAISVKPCNSQALAEILDDIRKRDDLYKAERNEQKKITKLAKGNVVDFKQRKVDPVTRIKREWDKMDRSDQIRTERRIYNEIMDDKDYPSEKLHSFHNFPSFSVKQGVAQHPNTSPETLHRLQDDENLKKLKGMERGMVKAVVAEHPNTSPETLHNLHQHDGIHVRKRVAEHPNTSLETLHKLHQDEHKGIRETVSKRLKQQKREKCSEYKDLRKDLEDITDKVQPKPFKPSRTFPQAQAPERQQVGDRTTYPKRPKTGAEIYRDPKTWSTENNMRKAITAGSMMGAPDSATQGETLHKSKLNKKEKINNVWDNFNKKQQLIGFLSEKLPKISERHKIALAKTIAYENYRKKEKLLSKLVKSDYRGDHKAPTNNGHSKPIHDLEGIYPEDIYHSPEKATRYYGHGIPHDHESIDILHSVKDNPHANVRIYRAIPDNADPSIGHGDWVTGSKRYAEDHGKAYLDGKYKIISKTVPAKHLFTDGNSIHEWGYSPSKKNKLAKGDVIDFKTRKPIAQDTQPEPVKERSRIDQLKDRFPKDDRFRQRLDELHQHQKHDEPYKYGDVHDIRYGTYRDSVDMFNSPMPIPVHTHSESVKGVVGKHVHLGGPDPFQYMDKKYKVGHKTLQDHKDLPLEINTRSDLIAHDEYLDHINPQKHKVNIHFFSDNDEINRILEPGAPSFKRRLDAARKLRDRGVDVKLVHNQIDHPDLHPDIKMQNAYDDKNIWKESKGKVGITPKITKLSDQAVDRVHKVTGIHHED